MRYGLGKPFILSERSVRATLNIQPKWFSLWPTYMNRDLFSKTIPWEGTLFSKSDAVYFERIAESGLPKSLLCVHGHPSLKKESIEMTRLQGEDRKARLALAIGVSPTSKNFFKTALTAETMSRDAIHRDVSRRHKEGYQSLAASNYLARLLPISDINFLKKEFVYTKLKYSRSPQYDSVSGGFAALLAGFIGFLISEKFGIELVDSGDFFIALMYLIFIGFIGRLAILTSSETSSPKFSFSPRHNIIFFNSVLTLFVSRIKFF